VPITLLKDPLASTRNTIRYSGAAAAAIGCIVAFVEASQLSASQRQFSSLNSTDKANLAQNSGAAWEAARNAKNNDLANLISSLGVVAIGTVGIFWSFRF
jgi:membrane protease subunit (stomatin/prohibitin family)